MKNKILAFLFMITLIIEINAEAQWTYSVTNAYAIGCPGYIAINGPVIGYTFQVNPPSLFGPVIPGNYGNVDFSVWPGVYSVTISQTSTGNILQTFNNVNVGQPTACGLDLINPSVTYGCYIDNSISFTVSGNFCASGNIQVMKNNVFYNQLYFGSPGFQFIYNLTPGSYFLTATDSYCTDTMTIVVNDNCAVPNAGFATTNIFKTSARANWTTKSCAVAYTVQYKKANTTTWTSKYVNSNIGNVKITGLTAGTTYKWRVRAKCNLTPASLSVWSPIQTLTTLPPRLANSEVFTNIEESIKVFPNPANQSFTIQSDFDFDDNVQLSLIDINGRDVGFTYVRSVDNEIIVNISSVVNGIYQIKISTPDNVIVKKLVVVK